MQTWPDGSCHIGQWKANSACGLGKIVHADGDVFQG